ncbi:MAG: multiheme c-type cytochrome [Polyangiaceae bacterium]
MSSTKVLPGPAEPHAAARPDAALANEACAACHGDVAAEWRASMHARAWVDPMFQRAFAREPLPFCRGCHAPEAAPDANPDPAVGDVGVGCITCHVPDRDAPATVVTGTRGHRAGTTAPHAVLRDARRGTDDVCTNCHEFEFPSRDRRTSRDLMQSTRTEHLASASAKTPCPSCHMPTLPDADETRLRNRVDHRFVASGDVATLARAVSVEVRRTSAGIVTVTLSPKDVGHAFPTGDLFRRLVVVLEAVRTSDGSRRVLGRHVLARRFRDAVVAMGTTLRVPAGDDRVGPSGRVEVFEIPSDFTDADLRWHLDYERAELPADASTHVEVASRLVVAGGPVPPAGATIPSPPLQSRTASSHEGSDP